MILEVTFTPQEFEAFKPETIRDATCVVFDIFRATSTIVTALGNGAGTIYPASSIADALSLSTCHTGAILAGERDGVRITSKMTGLVDFDLGNSPREFTSQNVRGRDIIITTTNGSRALKACQYSSQCLVGSFLNMSCTAEKIIHSKTSRCLLVCSGTLETSAYEDVLGAGAVIQSLLRHDDSIQLQDSAHIALQIFQQASRNLLESVKYSRNGRRLISMPELKDDVAFCLQRDIHSFSASSNGGCITMDKQ